MARRFKWTRKKWYAAHHQCRLLSRLAGGYPYGPPPLVERYIKLVDSIDGRDPLSIPIGYRYDRSDIPF